MEHVDDNIFNVRYNEKLDKLEMGNKKKKIGILGFVYKNKFIISIITAFFLFSWLNLWLIYKFYMIVELFE